MVNQSLSHVINFDMLEKNVTVVGWTYIYVPKTHWAINTNSKSRKLVSETDFVHPLG